MISNQELIKDYIDLDKIDYSKFNSKFNNFRRKHKDVKEYIAMAEARKLGEGIFPEICPKEERYQHFVALRDLALEMGKDLADDYYTYRANKEEKITIEEHEECLKTQEKFIKLTKELTNIYEKIFALEDLYEAGTKEIIEKEFDSMQQSLEEFIKKQTGNDDFTIPNEVRQNHKTRILQDYANN